MVTDPGSDALVAVTEFSDGRYVQFRCSPDRVLVAEVLSNLNIGEVVALTSDAEAALRKAGWNEPVQWVAPNWWTEARTADGLLELAWKTKHAVLNVLGERPENPVEIRTWSWSTSGGMTFDDLCRSNRHYFQEVLAEFIVNGHFARHIRRMRVLYRERRSALVDCVRKELGSAVEVMGDAAGMYLTVTLPEGSRDLEIAERAARQNLRIWPLSSSYMGEEPRQGFILGFGSTPVPAIAPAVRKLGQLLGAKRARE